jgi:hypothetical protein
MQRKIVEREIRKEESIYPSKPSKKETHRTGSAWK